MAKNETVSYECDKCGKKLKGYNNALNIVTSLSEGGYWSHLHVRILHRSGVHNDAKERDADLCKSCAVRMLTDAVARIRKGERCTAGAGEVKEQKWNG